MEAPEKKPNEIIILLFEYTGYSRLTAINNQHGRRTVYGMVISIILNSYGVERPEVQVEHSKQRVVKVSHQMRQKKRNRIIQDFYLAPCTPLWLTCVGCWARNKMKQMNLHQ